MTPPHVRGIVFTDSELAAVSEADAPGVSAYRQALDAMLEGEAAQTMPHDDIITLLDESAQTFEVLLLKTDEVIPYTSVFIRLECGYWDDAAEERLRDTLEAR